MTDYRCNPATSLSDDEVHEHLSPGQPGDDMILRLIRALRAEGAVVEIEEADGLGNQALVVAKIDGRRMRVSAEPW